VEPLVVFTVPLVVEGYKELSVVLLVVLLWVVLVLV
jgi:hypothetical protein